MRTDWDEYFLRIAEVAASRATCPRKHVGSVIVRDRTILSTGYNGSIRGMSHCEESGCLMVAGHCVRTAHAEANALIQAARNGTSVDNSSIYVTASPCWECFKLLANAGIKRVVYREFYREDKIFETAEQLSIELVHLNPDELQYLKSLEKELAQALACVDSPMQKVTLQEQLHETRRKLVRMELDRS